MSRAVVIGITFAAAAAVATVAAVASAKSSPSSGTTPGGGATGGGTSSGGGTTPAANPGVSPGTSPTAGPSSTGTTYGAGTGPYGLDDGLPQAEADAIVTAYQYDADPVTLGALANLTADQGYPMATALLTAKLVAVRGNLPTVAPSGAPGPAATPTIATSLSPTTPVDDPATVKSLQGLLAQIVSRGTITADWTTDDIDGDSTGRKFVRALTVFQTFVNRQPIIHTIPVNTAGILDAGTSAALIMIATWGP